MKWPKSQFSSCLFSPTFKKCDVFLLFDQRMTCLIGCADSLPNLIKALSTNFGQGDSSGYSNLGKNINFTKMEFLQFIICSRAKIYRIK